MIVIIDYKIGNMLAIKNIIANIGHEALISNNIKDISLASKLILSGVGAYDNGINNLKKLNLFELIEKKVLIDKSPILGICLGMQLMANNSEEGEQTGFGWIDATVKQFEKESCTTSIPVMGWNYIENIKPNTLIFQEKQRYYFAHSYYFPKETKESIAIANVGIDYCAAFQKENIFGVQFHPEKSHNYGKNLFRKFCEM